MVITWVKMKLFIPHAIRIFSCRESPLVPQAFVLVSDSSGTERALCPIESRKSGTVPRLSRILIPKSGTRISWNFIPGPLADLSPSPDCPVPFIYGLEPGIYGTGTGIPTSYRDTRSSLVEIGAKRALNQVWNQASNFLQWPNLQNGSHFRTCWL